MATALLLGLAIARPDVAKDALAQKGLPPSVYAARPCAVGEPPLASGFAAVGDVAAVAPVGAPWIAGETPPQPVIRLLARDGQLLKAHAPARADIVSIGKRTETIGGKAVERWSVSMMPCEGYLVRYDGLARIEPRILRRAGPARFAKSADAAFETRLRVKASETVGAGEGFTVAAFAVTPPKAARGDRHAKIDLAPPAETARCPLALLPRSEQPAWKDRFGDREGRRLPQHADACRAAAPASLTAASGQWLTDSAHGGRTNKVAAALLSRDLSDSDRLVFAFFGRLSSLEPAMFEGDAAARRKASRDVLSARRGAERVNASFDAILPNTPYCYENLRAGVDGPALNGVLVVELDASAVGEPLLKVEANAAAPNCAALKEPWSFTGAETRFYPHASGGGLAAAAVAPRR